MSVQTNLCDPNDLMFVSQLVYVNYETEKPRLKRYGFVLGRRASSKDCTCIDIIQYHETNKIR